MSHEWCPYCCRESVFPDEFAIFPCQFCGKELRHCAMCDKNCDNTLGITCDNCPLPEEKEKKE